jgi:hypothetical protein
MPLLSASVPRSVESATEPPTGSIGGCTITVALWGEEVPPGPVQVRVNVEDDVGGAIGTAPLTGCDPDQAPLAVQDVAFVLDQVKTTVFVAATVFGVALKLTVGRAAVPVLTDRFTADPVATLVPATGLSAMTLPEVTVELLALVIVPSTRPALVIAFVAAA